MTAKKLSLNDNKKNALIACLNNVAGRLDPDGARIYHNTARETAFARDRIHLTEAQVEITCFALRSAIASAGIVMTSQMPLVHDMLLQLTMTRRAYAAMLCDDDI